MFPLGVGSTQGIFLQFYRLNNDLSELGDYELLINNGVDGQYTVTNINNFKFICLVAKNDSSYFTASTVSVKMFKNIFTSGVNAIRAMLIVNNAPSQVGINYVDDTHIAVQGTASTRMACVWGIK